MWHVNKEVTEIPESDLLPGEISGELCVVGCYLVRKTFRVYNNELKPLADEPRFSEMKEYFYSSYPNRMIGVPFDERGCTFSEEVSVKHISELAKSTSEFHLVFQRFLILRWFDPFKISTIATLKGHVNDDDSTAKLLIKHNCLRRSSCDWEIYSPDGTITTL